jgi:hypothetical protein
MHCVNLTLPLIGLGAAIAAHAQEDETKLSTTGGAYVRLADVFRGRPTVLFYEDKDSTALNQPLKDALFQTAKTRGLLDAASVVAIANVRSYDWFPARNFVIAAVKSTEKTVGVPVYLDWNGAMTRKPWCLSPQSSTVVVLDRKGAVQLSKKGKLKDDEVAEIFALLERLLAS